jgi:hypothetical protein
VGGAAAGAILGKILGGKAGTGAAIGAAAGAARHCMTRGPDPVVKAGATVNITLDRSVREGPGLGLNAVFRCQGPR